MVLQGTTFSKSRNVLIRKKKSKKKPIKIQDNDFGRQFRIGMKNRRKLGKQGRHYEYS